MRRTAILCAVLVLFQSSSTSLQAQSSGSGLLFVFSVRTDGAEFNALAVDSRGLIWAIGHTSSPALPTTPDALQPTMRGRSDAFIEHMRPDGTVLYLSYLGGSDGEIGFGIAVDRHDNVYVTGRTTSPDFPVTAGAFDVSCGSDGTCRNITPTTQIIEPDGFVTKLSPSGRILYSTFLGGSGSDAGTAIAVDGSGRAHVAGVTQSSDMPRTADAAGTSVPGSSQQDAFYARLSADGSRLEYATPMGGSRIDDAAGVAVDASGNAYVVGATQSSDFTLARALKSTYPPNAGVQGWIAKFTATGLEYSSYIGGSNSDSAAAVAVSANAVYLSGDACSNDFPGAPRPGAPAHACDQAAYVTKLTLDGTALLRTTLLDGGATDWAQALTVDAGDTVFVTGFTDSTNFPVTAEAAQKSNAGRPDIFFAVVPLADTASGTPSYSTYLGGSVGGEFGRAVALDGFGGAFIGGSSAAQDFPTVNGTASSSRTEGQAFIAHFASSSASRRDVDGEVVLHARDATIHGDWQIVPDPTAAGSARVWNPDAGVPKIMTAAASPSAYFELTFQAQAGKSYHLWLRMKADDDFWANDSVFVQFSDSVDASGNAVWRTGTTSATTVSLEDCTGCGEHGWGWNDNGYNVRGFDVFFPTTGAHTIRIQQREDGISIDQIVLSSWTYLNSAPGASKADATVLAQSIGAAPPPPPPPPSNDPLEIVLYVAPELLPGSHNWFVVPDSTAARGARLFNNNRDLPKSTSPLSSYPDYFEVRFSPQAGVPYHLWVRGNAFDDYYGNDSVFIQFSDSVDANGNPVWRLNTDSATYVSLEDCTGCGEQAWGWTDNAYGAFAAPIYFGKSGPQTIRVIRREDGLSIDQIVISAGTYLNTAPGALKNDATIVPK